MKQRKPTRTRVLRDVRTVQEALSILEIPKKRLGMLAWIKEKDAEKLLMDIHARIPRFEAAVHRGKLVAVSNECGFAAGLILGINYGVNNHKKFECGGG